MLSVEVAVDADTELLGSLSSLNWMQYFVQWLTHLQPDQSPIDAYGLALRLTNDEDIQQLNATYRQQEKPTDVLAFASLESELPGATEIYAEEPVYLGDIIVSVETAQRQALEAGHSLPKELLWLATHGLLHLLGWDHPDEESLNQMLSKQSDLIQLTANSADGS